MCKHIASLTKRLTKSNQNTKFSQVLGVNDVDGLTPPCFVDRRPKRNRTHRNGSMLIQYNCVRFECEPGLIDGLRDIVSVRPANVYLAPYPAMDAKIALAAPGRLVTMDELDESRVNAFIDENLRR